MPTKSSVGVKVMTSHGCPKLPGKRVKDALISSPLRGERKKKSSLIGLALQPIGFTHVVVGNSVQLGEFQPAVLQSYALLAGRDER